MVKRSGKIKNLSCSDFKNCKNCPMYKVNDCAINYRTSFGNIAKILKNIDLETELKWVEEDD